jgi:hypothetical protein
MNTFFAQRGYRLTMNESARLSAQVRQSSSYSHFELLLVMPLRTCADILPLMYCRLGLGCRITSMTASGFGLAALLPSPGSWRRGTGSLCLCSTYHRRRSRSYCKGRGRSHRRSRRRGWCCRRHNGADYRRRARGRCTGTCS